MKIYIPLDGSPVAEKALAPAALLARRSTPPATLVLSRFAIYPAAALGLAGDVAIMPTQELFDDLEAETRAYLNTIAAAPELAGLTVQTVVEIGSPAEGIPAQAQREGADLIVMTSHSRTGIVRFALGSVAQTVAREAQMPVLIIRADHPDALDITRHRPLTILVPLDGGGLAEAAIEPAAQFAKALLGAIYLVRVLPAGHNDVVHAITAQEAYAYLTVWHDRLERQGITVHRALAYGDPAEQIIAKAQEVHADLVAIATHGRTGLARLMEGSIAETVLHRTSLPTLVVHPVAAPVVP
jgi:nucleotide-binding universal stress UspA family protein